MPAIHSGAAVLKTKLHLVYILPFVVLWKQRSVHAIVEVWPYSQNFWSQNFRFLKSTLNANWTTTLLIYYACVSSTLVLLVLNTLQRKLCIAFQGTMSFPPTGKIASSHKKIAVRTMVAHGACFLCINLCWVTKMWASQKCEIGYSQYY